MNNISLTKKTPPKGLERFSIAIVLMAFCLLLAGGSWTQDLEARRQQVDQMTQTEKAQLFRLWERFEALPPEQHESIRQLDSQIAGDEQAEKLKAIMRRYYQWCRTLPAYQRLELQELPIKQRIVKIKNLKRQSEDIAGMKKWFDAKAEKIAVNLSEEKRTRLSKEPNAPYFKRMMLFKWMYDMGDKNRKGINPLKDQDLADLRSHLSEPTRQLLEQKLPQEQWKTILKRVRHHFQSQARRHRPGRPRNRTPDGISTEDLAASFQNLSSSRQDALLSLPAEEMLQQLQQSHIEHRIHRSRPKNPNYRPQRFQPGKKRPH